MLLQRERRPANCNGNWCEVRGIGAKHFLGVAVADRTSFTGKAAQEIFSVYQYALNVAFRPKMIGQPQEIFHPLCFSEKFHSFSPEPTEHVYSWTTTGQTRAGGNMCLPKTVRLYPPVINKKYVFFCFR